MTTSTSHSVQPDSFKIADYFGPERRLFERRRVRYRAEARRMDNSVHAQREPRFALTILDISDGGIRATSRSMVLTGERITVLLPPEANMPARIFGKIVRSSPRKDGYELSIRFDYIPAA